MCFCWSFWMKMSKLQVKYIRCKFQLSWKTDLKNYIIKHYKFTKLYTILNGPKVIFDLTVLCMTNQTYNWRQIQNLILMQLYASIVFLWKQIKNNYSLKHFQSTIINITSRLRYPLFITTSLTHLTRSIQISSYYLGLYFHSSRCHQPISSARSLNFHHIDCDSGLHLP